MRGAYARRLAAMPRTGGPNPVGAGWDWARPSKFRFEAHVIGASNNVVGRGIRRERLAADKRRPLGVRFERLVGGVGH